MLVPLATSQSVGGFLSSETMLRWGEPPNMVWSLASAVDAQNARQPQRRRDTETQKGFLSGVFLFMFVLGYLDVVVVDFVVVGEAPEPGVAVAIGDGVFHLDEPLSGLR